MKKKLKCHVRYAVKPKKYSGTEQLIKEKQRKITEGR